MSVNKKLNGELVSLSTGGFNENVPIATSTTLGKVKPDGTTIVVDEYGTLSTDTTLIVQVPYTTTFNQDGTITTTYPNQIEVTTFNNDGSITESLYEPGSSTPYSVKRTVIGQDGNITVTVS